MRRMRPALRSAAAPPSQLPAELKRATSLIDQKQWEAATELLESVCRRYPNSKQAHSLLLEVAQEIQDRDLIESTVAHLARLLPDDPEIQMAYAEVAAIGGYQALALKRFLTFLERWPQHKEAKKISGLVSEMEAELAKNLDAAGLTGENRLEMGALNDEVRYLMHHAQYAAAKQAAQTLLALTPHYAPAFNNLSLICYLEGELAEAIAYSRRVVEFDPENIHALGSLARYLYMSGQEEEAYLMAKRMRSSPSYAADKYGKEAETLSFLGDNAGVMEVYRRACAEQSREAESPMLLHLAAVALLRSGEEKEAQRCWKAALQKAPNHLLAKPNWEDLKLPVGERNGPWAFGIAQWLPVVWIRALASDLDKRGSQPEKARRAFLEQHPAILHTVPLLLERGDPVGRELAFELASFLRTPEMLAALQTFALSPYGQDRLRIQAATIAMQEGQLESSVTLWVKGKQTEIQLLGFEISYEPAPSDHSEAVLNLIERSVHALEEGDAAQGEALLQEALQIEPDAPDLLNNLAAAYSMQGRKDEHARIIEQLYTKHPDYFFAKINMAYLLVDQRRLEEAEALVRPLMSLKSLHISEFRALCTLQMQIALHKNEPERMEQWLAMWEEIEEHPLQEGWRMRVNLMQLPSQISRRRKKR